MSSMSQRKKINLIGIITLIMVFSVLCALCLWAITSKLNTEKINLIETSQAKTEHKTEVPEGYTTISNVNGLKAISTNPSGKYILMSDINLSDVVWDVIPTFSGTLDGNNYTISNLNIESNEQYVGMFGKMTEGTIKDLTLENVTVKSTYTDSTAYVGIMMGYMSGTSTKVQNINITGVSKVENTQNISLYMGAIVGELWNGNVTDCHSNATIIANGTTNDVNVGGLIGKAFYGTITSVSANANITATSTSGSLYTGGLIGYSQITISKAYSTGKLTTNTQTGVVYIGGLAGILYANANSISINNAYSTVEVTANSTSASVNVGGLVGRTTNKSTNQITVSYTYAVGKVTAETSGTKNIGGLIGSTSNTSITSSYYNPETTKQNTSAGGTSTSFNSMLHQNLYKSWDFNSTWVIEEGSTLPYLKNMIKPEAVKEQNYQYLKYEGEGTEQNPYKIKTKEQLQGIIYDLNASYQLQNNIDLTDTAWQVPTTSFTGTFDGNNFTISNMKVESNEQYVGMFGYLGLSTIKNLTLENVTIKSNYTDGIIYIGTLAGCVGNSNTKIENVHVIGENKIEYKKPENTKTLYIAGLVGYLSGSITNSNSNTNIEAVSAGQINVGGLVANVSNGNITNANTNGNITATTSRYVYAGGLVGILKGNITNSFSNSNLEATTSSYIYAGGLVGYTQSGNNNTISNSNANGNITATSTSGYIYAGGVIGNAYDATISKVYSVGKVVANTQTGQIYAGGLIGLTYANTINTTVNNAYATGDVTANATSGSVYASGLISSMTGKSTYKASANYTYAVGEITTETEGTQKSAGLVAYLSSSATLYNSYYSPETTKQYSTVNGTPALFEDMLHQNLYQNWNFNSIWQIDEGNSLPYLKDMTKPEKVNKEHYEYTQYEGEGTEQNPYLIKTEAQLQNLSTIQVIKGNSPYYCKLANDISITELFEPIGNETIAFAGTLDGANHTISNMQIESSEPYVGIFGYIKGGSIHDLTLQDISVKGSCNTTNATAYVGALAGYAKDATIRKISILGTNTVENEGTASKTYIGSMVGYNDSIIKYTYSNATISVKNGTETLVGGLVGANSRRVQDSYYQGNMNIQSEKIVAGGIAGENTQHIRKTYAIGEASLSETTVTSGGIAGTNAGHIIHSYWNLTNINQNSENGTYESLDALEKQETYEGWNFDAVWSIQENVSTPVFDFRFENIEYCQESYWDWHTRTTTDDTAYNGKHIQIIDDTFNFFGYDDISYKDFLYKDYSYAGRKTFRFLLDESAADYHTLEGAGFIFNASIKNNKLSGYVLLYSKTKIGIYRIENQNVEAFKTTDNTTISSNYTKEKILEIDRKTNDTIHDITVEVTPTSVIVNDNEEELIRQELDYSKHAGESFGLIASYAHHACNQLSKIIFEDFSLEIDDYIMYATKTDENGKPLKGAVFEVENEKGEKVEEGESNSNGIFQVKGLQEGIYTVKETQAPTGYIKDTKEQKFKFTNDGKMVDTTTGEAIKLTFVNKAVKVELTKLETNSNSPIQGVKFALYHDALATEPVTNTNGEEVQAVSDSSGKVIFQGFNPGTYYYKEIQEAPGYKGSSKIYQVIVDELGHVTFEDQKGGTVYNEKIMVDVTITKTGEIKDSKEVTFLPGATITLYNAEGTQIQEKVTGEDGKVIFEKLTVGTYTYKETKAPQGYELNNTTYTFTVNQDESITFKGENNGTIYNSLEAIKRDVTIKKQWTSIEIPLHGAVIGLYDEAGREILDAEGHPIRVITDEQGMAKFEGLKPGIYQYREIIAPNGYYINANMYKVIVKEDGTIDYGSNRGIIYDARKQYGHWSGAGGGSGSGGRASVQITDGTGHTTTYETDDSGNVKIPDLAPGSYTITVTDSQGNKHTGSLVVGEDGSYRFSGGIGNNFYMVYDDFIQITITKRRAGVGTLLGGAIIELYDRNGKVVGRATTDILGRVTFSGLKPGVYYYKEVVAPNGYYIDSNQYQIIVKDNGTIDYGTHNGILYDARKQYVHWGGHGTGVGGSGSGNGHLGGGNGSGGRVKVEIEGTGETEGSSFETDEFGNGRIPDLPVGRHHVTVTDGNGNQYTGDIVVDENGNYTFEGDIQNDFTMQYGDIITVEITKMIEGTDIVLEGAVIELYDESGNVIATATTNREGKAVFSGLKPETIYQYKEGSAPTGYVLNSKMYRFRVDQEGNIIDIEGNRIIYNARVAITGNLVITKRGADTDIVLQGAVIGVFSAENDQVIQTETTNENGQITFKNLEPGEYYYKEITAPNGYQINEEKYYFTVQEDGSILFQGNTNAIIYDELIGIDLPIYKIDAITHAIIQGAKLGIYDQDGNFLAEGITDENGRVVFHNLVVGRTYQYKEIEAPEGYVLDDTMYSFTITNENNIQCTGQIIEIDGISYIALYNHPIQPELPLGVDVTIYKKDAITKRILQGAVIGLYDASGNVITVDGKALTVTTDALGRAVFTGLKPGTYQYKEEVAPNGYRLNENVYTFTVQEDGSILFHDNTEGILYDELIGIDLPIYKIDIVTHAIIQGAKLGIYDQDGNFLAEGITDEYGKVVFRNLLVGKTYQYKEIEPPRGYVLDDTMYSFTITNENNIQCTGQIIEIDGVSYIAIYNQPIQPELPLEVDVTIYKKDILTRKVLQGAVIGLYDASGNAITIDGKTVTATTDASGRAVFTGLKPGTYQYKEEVAPNGYRLNENVYTFTVQEDGSILFYDNTEGILYDELIEIDLPIYKIDAITHAIIQGAKLGIYDQDGNFLAEGITDEYGKVVFHNLVVGKTYQYKEIEAPEGYVLDDTMYSLTITNENNIQCTGQIIEIDGVSYIAIYNQPIQPELPQEEHDPIEVDVTIYKKDILTRKVLQGAVIGLYDASGNAITIDGKAITVTTDASGRAVFTGLKPGTYQYKEEVAPNGYRINEKMYTFTISEDGMVLFDSEKGILYNEKLEVEIPTNQKPNVTPDTKLPQTGLNLLTIGGVILFVTLLGGTLTIAMTIHYKKKENKKIHILNKYL